MENFDFSVLSISDIFYSAIGALLLMWIIKAVVKVVKIIKDPESILNSGEDLRIVIQKCYKLFPQEIVQFNGETFKRGMTLKIVTLQEKIFEGEFIGCNEKNMLCIITNKYIVAHELTNIQKIQIIDNIIDNNYTQL